MLDYTTAFNNKMLIAHGDLASTQEKVTEKTMEAISHLLNYTATHPNEKIRYHKRIMMLHIHSDV